MQSLNPNIFMFNIIALLRSSVKRVAHGVQINKFGFEAIKTETLTSQEFIYMFAITVIYVSKVILQNSKSLWSTLLVIDI